MRKTSSLPTGQQQLVGRHVHFQQPRKNYNHFECGNSTSLVGTVFFITQLAGYLVKCGLIRRKQGYAKSTAGTIVIHGASCVNSIYSRFYTQRIRKLQTLRPVHRIQSFLTFLIYHDKPLYTWFHTLKVHRCDCFFFSLLASKIILCKIYILLQQSFDM